MKISQEGIALIKKFEGCDLKAYMCAADVLTIGYGHTATVHENMQITQEVADKLLLGDLEIYEKAVNENVKVPLDENQFSSLVSWTFNLGETNLKNSTLLKVLNENKHDEVPAQIRRWNKAGGRVLEGLIRRREAEALLFEGKEWHEV